MIVVTGASGMLGSQIVLTAALAQKPVCGLYRSPSALASVKASWSAQGHAEVFDRVTWRQADLLDALDTADALEGATQVVHAAAIVSFRKKDESFMFQANPQMSENLWLAALDRGVQFGLHISSIATLSVALRGFWWNPAPILLRSSIWVLWSIAVLGVSYSWPQPRVVLRSKKSLKKHPRKFCEQSLIHWSDHSLSKVEILRSNWA